MHQLHPSKQACAVAAFRAGASIIETAEAVDASKNTISRLIVNMATAADRFQDGAFRDLDVHRVEADETRRFRSAGEPGVPVRRGDPRGASIWKWIAIDADTGLLITWHFGRHTARDCALFLDDLYRRVRAGSRVQLVVPSSRIYSPIVDAIGRNALFVDRHDLTMRTDLSAVERYGRDFTDAVERQARALAVRVAYHNLCRLHELLGGDFGCNTTPAMAARVTDRVWSSADLVVLLDRYEAA